MKIITQQKISDWSCKVTCGHCDSELLVEPDDVHCIVHNQEQDPRDEYYEKYSAICAVCNHKLSIPQDKLPKIVKIMAKKSSPASDFDNNYR